MKVDKNIPIPARTTIYPWDEMKVGDSFLFEGSRNTIAASAGQRKARKNESYTIRKVEGGLRVWRTA